MPRTVDCLPNSHGEPMTSVGHLPVFIDGEQRNKVGICILPNHSSILLPGESRGQKESGGLQSIVLQSWT